MICKPYAECKEGGYTHENKFFRPAIAGNDDSNGVMASSPLVVQVTKDAAFVRLLQVCQYVSVPVDFYENVSLSFILE